MNRVTHFEIIADDPERLHKFYSTVLGWRFEKWEGPMEYWMVYTGEGAGIDGGMSIRQPDSSTMNTIEIENLDATLVKITDNGGKILDPKRAIPGIGWFAVFMDTDENVFGLMQSDPEAK